MAKHKGKRRKNMQHTAGRLSGISLERKEDGLHRGERTTTNHTSTINNCTAIQKRHETAWQDAWLPPRPQNRSTYEIENDKKGFLRSTHRHNLCTSKRPRFALWHSFVSHRMVLTRGEKTPCPCNNPSRIPSRRGRPPWSGSLRRPTRRWWLPRALPSPKHRGRRVYGGSGGVSPVGVVVRICVHGRIDPTIQTEIYISLHKDPPLVLALTAPRWYKRLVHKQKNSTPPVETHEYCAVTAMATSLTPPGSVRKKRQANRPSQANITQLPTQPSHPRAHTRTRTYTCKLHTHTGTHTSTHAPLPGTAPERSVRRAAPTPRRLKIPT